MTLILAWEGFPLKVDFVDSIYNACLFLLADTIYTFPDMYDITYSQSMI